MTVNQNQEVFNFLDILSQIAKTHSESMTTKKVQKKSHPSQ
jgi:hypothetical protein